MNIKVWVLLIVADKFDIKPCWTKDNKMPWYFQSQTTLSRLKNLIVKFLLTMKTSSKCGNHRCTGRMEATRYLLSFVSWFSLWGKKQGKQQVLVREERKRLQKVSWPLVVIKCRALCSPLTLPDLEVHWVQLHPEERFGFKQETCHVCTWSCFFFFFFKIVG